MIFMDVPLRAPSLKLAKIARHFTEFPDDLRVAEITCSGSRASIA